MQEFFERGPHRQCLPKADQEACGDIRIKGSYSTPHPAKRAAPDTATIVAESCLLQGSLARNGLLRKKNRRVTVYIGILS